jgi:enamine deaminase RidA (YjgF/YER057c/UK114 family)
MTRFLRRLTSVVALSVSIGWCTGATAGEVEDRLKPVLEKLGYAEGKLPVPKPAFGNYVDAVQVGKLLFLSSAGPQTPSGDFMKGRVPDQVGVPEAETSLQLSCVRQLARIKQAIGDLDQIKRIVFLRGKVQTVSGFGDLPRIVDACSSLLVTAFGDAGRHTRTSEGYAALPFNLVSEVEITVELK